MYSISIKIIDWLKKQIELENQSIPLPDIHKRDIFWARLGYNIGFEQFGKGEHFTRPVLVLRKFNKRLFLAIPLSTKIKEDNEYYVKYTFKGVFGSALISQARVLDTKRLTDYIGRLDEKNFANIKTFFVKMVVDEG